MGRFSRPCGRLGRHGQTNCPFYESLQCSGDRGVYGHADIQQKLLIACRVDALFALRARLLAALLEPFCPQIEQARGT
jgi:hypothetical protein